MSDGIWNLYAEPSALDTAATRWVDVATALREAADALTSRSSAVVAAGFEGSTADAWEAHRRDLVASLDRAEGLAGDAAGALSTAAGSIRVAQGHLDASWATVVAIPHQGSPSGAIRFETEDDAEAARVTAAVARAEEVRRELDAALTADVRAFDDARTAWREIAGQWGSVAAGTTPPFDLPADADGVGMIRVGDGYVLNTGAGDDEVSIEYDEATGDQVVTVNGQVYRIPGGAPVVIRVGAGNDTVTVPEGGRFDFTVLGGDGDDSLEGSDGDDRLYGLGGDDEVDGGDGDDRVSGGDGRDYLDGQDGDDVVTGGQGDDTLYGLGGDDTLAGGEGQDYHEGGTGDDLLVGGAGDDILSGGDDDDTLHGGAGDDVGYAGRGADTTYGGTGDDTTHQEAGDTSDTEHRVTIEIHGFPDYIRIEGSDEFRARVEADLQMLASSPRGQMMLDNLQRNYDDSGFLGIGKDGLTIREYAGNDNSFASENGDGSADVDYSRRVDSVQGAPPAVVLYHELGHVYDYVNETFRGDSYDGDDPQDSPIPGRDDVREGERQATGLPIDHDDDDSTPEVIDPDHPFDYTENGLRDEMGLPSRDHYRG